MPARKLPNSTPTVLRTLRTARDERKRTAPADHAISAEQWAQLDDTIPAGTLNRMITAIAGVDNALATQTAATANLNAVSARLAMACSHFHQTFDNSIARGFFSPSDRNYFERPATATAIPVARAHDDIAETAERIVTGEAARQAAAAPGVPLTLDSGLRMDSGLKMDSTIGGFVAVQQPSAAEVGALLAQFQAATTDSDQALVATDQAREALQAVYPAALALAVDICDTVEFFYRHDPDASSRRAKCERWGVVYAFDDAGMTPPPPPAPPAAPAAR